MTLRVFQEFFGGGHPKQSCDHLDLRQPMRAGKQAAGGRQRVAAGGWRAEGGDGKDPEGRKCGIS